jgi:hypothetical protein
MVARIPVKMAAGFYIPLWGSQGMGRSRELEDCCKAMNSDEAPAWHVVVKIAIARKIR